MQNLNGYLYEGTNTVPFSQYPLEAYTIHGPPAPPAPPAPPSPPSPGTMECNVLALNATLPLYSYEAAFPMATTVIDGGDWWDIAQIYRQWVLPNAHWTKRGALDTRSDLPSWLENITLWMNNNWGATPCPCDQTRRWTRGRAQGGRRSSRGALVDAGASATNTPRGGYSVLAGQNLGPGGQLRPTGEAS